MSRILRRAIAMAAILFSTAACATSAAGQRRELPENLQAPGADIDPVHRAMLAELGRSWESLRIQDYEAPYYIAYAIKETRRASVGAKLGSLHYDSESRARTAYVDVRVGDYAFDSSEDDELDWIEDNVYEPSPSVPIEDQLPAIRHTLWLMTDLRYKQALSSYHKLLGQRVYEAKGKRKRPSFSRAPAATYLEDPVQLDELDPDARELARELSAMVGRAEKVFDSEVQIVFQVETRWFVNVEGALLRTVHPLYSIHVNAYTRSDDGMLIQESVDRYARHKSALPGREAMVEATRQMLSNLEALRVAPEMDPYTGPAILEPTATGVFFHEVLGHRLEGHRVDDDQEGQTFANYLGKKIVPDFISVIDDPTVTHQGDTRLNGQYAFDDEGVAARRVVLVDRGVLRNFLLPRRPVEGFDRSNGHGRAQGNQRPVARMGNLIVEAHRTVSRDRLREMLLEEVRRQGKPYGLIIKELTGGATNTSSYGFQAFKGQARMVYKLDAASGAETLVRGVDIVGTPLISIGKIIAASDDTGTFNGYCGAESGMVPVSTVAPATLFREIELQRTLREESKGPILDVPLQ